MRLGSPHKPGLGNGQKRTTQLAITSVVFCSQTKFQDSAPGRNLAAQTHPEKDIGGDNLALPGPGPPRESRVLVACAVSRSNPWHEEAIEPPSEQLL